MSPARVPAVESAMMNNTFKPSRNSFVAEKRVGRSDDVFANAVQFVQHHEAGPRRGRR